mmetsp:Transcript_15509/g.33101  ORF Transcript_15509/g.33101 Transcript_15509/m.33101 type:complete len:241 (-) Transcript_15509:134-856(-)
MMAAPGGLDSSKHHAAKLEMRRTGLPKRSFWPRLPDASKRVALSSEGNSSAAPRVMGGTSLAGARAMVSMLRLISCRSDRMCTFSPAWTRLQKPMVMVSAARTRFELASTDLPSLPARTSRYLAAASGASLFFCSASFPSTSARSFCAWAMPSRLSGESRKMDRGVKKHSTSLMTALMRRGPMRRRRSATAPLLKISFQADSPWRTKMTVTFWVGWFRSWSGSGVSLSLFERLPSADRNT